MPTKAQLEARVQALENDNRRIMRALGQAQLDLDITPNKEHDHLTPHPTALHVKEAIARAKSELNRVVIDPCPRIDAYIKSSEGIGWSWEKPYTKNGQFAWCGAFAAFCYTKVNSRIKKKIFPSCYRLYSNWGKTSRHISLENIEPGDIVVVFTAKRSLQGDHITLCVDNSTMQDGYITTIEGNAHGELGNGERGEGVITRKRNLDEVAHVYRLLGHDYDE